MLIPDDTQGELYAELIWLYAAPIDMGGLFIKKWVSLIIFYT